MNSTVNSERICRPAESNTFIFWWHDFKHTIVTCLHHSIEILNTFSWRVRGVLIASSAVNEWDGHLRAVKTLFLTQSARLFWSFQPRLPQVSSQVFLLDQCVWLLVIVLVLKVWSVLLIQHTFCQIEWISPHGPLVRKCPGLSQGVCAEINLVFVHCRGSVSVSGRATKRYTSQWGWVIKIRYLIGWCWSVIGINVMLHKQLTGQNVSKCRLIKFNKSAADWNNSRNKKVMRKWLFWLPLAAHLEHAPHVQRLSSCCSGPLLHVIPNPLSPHFPVTLQLLGSKGPKITKTKENSIVWA